MRRSKGGKGRPVRKAKADVVDGRALRTADAENVLQDIVERIRKEHAAVEASMGRALEHAIEAGRLLIDARERVKHGDWLPWLRSLGFAPRTAQAYMQLAKSTPLMTGANAQRVAHLSIRGALAALNPEAKALKGFPVLTEKRKMSLHLERKGDMYSGRKSM